MKGTKMTNLEFYKEEIKEKYKHKKHYSDNTLCREDLADTLYEIWKENAPLTTDMLDWLYEEKPVKPYLEYDGNADGYPVYDTWACPRCGESYEYEYEEYNYCPNCGQKIDWSDYDEEKSIISC